MTQFFSKKTQNTDRFKPWALATDVDEECVDCCDTPSSDCCGLTHLFYITSTVPTINDFTVVPDGIGNLNIQFANPIVTTYVMSSNMVLSVQETLIKYDFPTFTTGQLFQTFALSPVVVPLLSIAIPLGEDNIVDLLITVNTLSFSDIGFTSARSVVYKIVYNVETEEYTIELSFGEIQLVHNCNVATISESPFAVIIRLPTFSFRLSNQIDLDSLEYQMGVVFGDNLCGDPSLGEGDCTGYTLGSFWANCPNVDYSEIISFQAVCELEEGDPYFEFMVFIMPLTGATLVQASIDNGVTWHTLATILFFAIESWIVPWDQVLFPPGSTIIIRITVDGVEVDRILFTLPLCLCVLNFAKSAGLPICGVGGLDWNITFTIFSIGLGQNIVLQYEQTPGVWVLFYDFGLIDEGVLNNITILDIYNTTPIVMAGSYNIRFYHVEYDCASPKFVVEFPPCGIESLTIDQLQTVCLMGQYKFDIDYSWIDLATVPDTLTLQVYNTGTLMWDNLAIIPDFNNLIIASGSTVHSGFPTYFFTPGSWDFRLITGSGLTSLPVTTILLACP